MHTDYVEVPHGIMKFYKDVTLTRDIFFVNLYTLFVMLSQNIKFKTVEDIKAMDSGILIQACEQVFLII